LLRAAYGVNRQETGGRTAPSTHNWQDIDIYVASADGLYLFDAKSHALKMIQAKDIRALTGIQDFVANAPVNLIFVSDFTRMGPGTSQKDKRIAAAIDTGFIKPECLLVLRFHRAGDRGSRGGRQGCLGESDEAQFNAMDCRGAERA
jgi:hypothetical protein